MGSTAITDAQALTNLVGGDGHIGGGVGHAGLRGGKRQGATDSLARQHSNQRGTIAFQAAATRQPATAQHHKRQLCCHSWAGSSKAAARLLPQLGGCAAARPCCHRQVRRHSAGSPTATSQQNRKQSPVHSGRRPGRPGRSGPQSGRPPYGRSWGRRPRGSCRAGQCLRGEMAGGGQQQGG